MRRTLCLVLMLAAAAQAQSSDPLWPLAPGNSWTYAGSAGVFQWTAVDSVETPVGRRPGLRAGDGSGPADCAVDLVAKGTGGIEVRLLDPVTGVVCTAIHLPTASGPLVLQPAGTGSVVVGGQTVPARPLAVAQSESGGPGNYRSVWYAFAGGLGLTSYSSLFLASGGVSINSGYALRQATISGVQIGQSIGPRADFWPLQVGNRWEFALVRDPQSTPDGAVAWTVVANGTGVALRLDRIAGTSVVATVTCPVTITGPSAATSWRTVFALGCTLPDPALFPSLDSAAGALAIDLYERQTVSVGTQTLDADVASGGISRIGPNWIREVSYRLARELGPVGYRVTNPDTAPYGTGWTATLGYARVGDQTYGTQIVAASEAPLAAPAFALAVAPNPTAGAAQVRFALDAPARVRLVVTDALGRSVRTVDAGVRVAGEHTLSVALDRVAAGVYAIRLEAGDRAALVRLSVIR